MTWTTRPRSDVGGLPAITAGHGPLVVLLHGVGLRAEAWNAQIDALARDHRVIAFDMAGHGAAPLPGQAMTLTDYTSAVAAAMVEPGIVVGHSMGAMIALHLAATHPDKVRGVAALNAIYRRSAAAAGAVRSRAQGLDGTTIADPSATLDRWFGHHVTPERTACEDWLRSVDPAGYGAAYRVFAQEDGPSDTTLSGLKCPALFMTGDQEPNSTPAMSQAMANLAPQGKAVILPDAAHMMPMTHPKAVNAALSSLIERCQT